MEDPIKIGQLDRRVQFVELMRTITSTGATSTVDNVVANLWAKIVDITGTEENDGKVFALAVRKYIIRYDETIAKSGERMWIIDGEDRYNIHSIALQGRKQYLILNTSKKE